MSYLIQNSVNDGETEESTMLALTSMIYAAVNNGQNSDTILHGLQSSAEYSSDFEGASITTSPHSGASSQNKRERQ